MPPSSRSAQRRPVNSLVVFSVTKPQMHAATIFVTLNLFSSLVMNSGCGPLFDSVAVQKSCFAATSSLTRSYDVSATSLTRFSQKAHWDVLFAPRKLKSFRFHSSRLTFHSVTHQGSDWLYWWLCFSLCFLFWLKFFLVFFYFLFHSWLYNGLRYFALHHSFCLHSNFHLFFFFLLSCTVSKRCLLGEGVMMYATSEKPAAVAHTNFGLWRKR